MRGYWNANRGAAHSSGQHFPDTWKTPYDTTFSRESRYAAANNPLAWKGNVLVNTLTGKTVYGAPGAVFSAEGPAHYLAAFLRNKQWALPAPKPIEYRHA